MCVCSGSGCRCGDPQPHCGTCQREKLHEHTVGKNVPCTHKHTYTATPNIHVCWTHNRITTESQHNHNRITTESEQKRRCICDFTTPLPLPSARIRLPLLRMSAPPPARVHMCAHHLISCLQSPNQCGNFACQAQAGYRGRPPGPLLVLIVLLPSFVLATDIEHHHTACCRSSGRAGILLLATVSGPPHRHPHTGAVHMDGLACDGERRGAGAAAAWQRVR